MFPWGFNQQNYRKCGVCYLFRNQFGLNHLFAIFRTGICIVNDWRVWIQFYSQKKDFTKIFGNHPESPLGILDWMNYNILTTTTSPTSPWTLAIAEFCSSKSTMILVEQTPSPCGPLAIPLIHCKVAQTGPPGMILCVPMLLVVQKVRKYRNKSQCCFRWSMWCHIITCYSTHDEILDQFNAYLRTPSELGWLWAVRVKRNLADTRGCIPYSIDAHCLRALHECSIHVGCHGHRVIIKFTPVWMRACAANFCRGVLVRLVFLLRDRGLLLSTSFCSICFNILTAKVQGEKKAISGAGCSMACDNPCR